MTRKFHFVVGALLAAAIQCVSAQVLVAPGDPRGNPGPASPRAGVPERMLAGRCNESLCRLEIKVNTGGGCDIRVDPEWLFIGGQQVQIVWEIKSPGYSLDEVQGIRFKDDYNPLWRTEFYQAEGRGKNGGSTWEVFDANSTRGTFRYAVTVTNDRTREQCHADPGVVNDWP